MFKVVAGDFLSITRYHSSSILEEKKLFAANKEDSRGNCKTEEINLKGNIDKIEVVTEESKKKFIGTAGWGLVGATALGPLGLIAGALVGGNKKEICFVCYLKDDRKFMAIADPGTYQEIVAAQFEQDELKPEQKVPWVSIAGVAFFCFIIFKLI